MPVPTYSELDKMTDADIIKIHDSLTEHAEVNIQYCLNELARRDVSRQTATMRRLTWAIAVMTVIVTGATIMNVVITYWLYRRP